MKIIYLYSFVFLFCIIHSLEVFAQKKVQIKEGLYYENASSKAYYLIDEKDEINIQDILKAENQSLFQVYEDNTINFGYTYDAVWIKLMIDNPTLEPAILQPDILRYEILELYEVSQDGGYKSEKFNSSQTFSEREIKGTYHTFSIEPFSKKTYYLKLKSNINITFSLHIYNYSSFIYYDHRKSFFYGIYYGLVILIAFFNLFVFFILKERLYFYYSLSVLGSGMIIMNVTGHGFEFLWFDYPILNQFTHSFTLISTLANLWFSINFLKVGRINPLWRKTAYVIITSILLSILINFFDTGLFVTRFTQVIFLVSILYIIALSVNTYSLGFKTARFFVFAWTIYLVSSLFAFLLTNRAFYNIPELFDFLTIGSAIEVTLLSFAVADRVKFEKIQREDIEIENISLLKENARILEEQNELLGKKIDKRSIQIDRQNQILMKSQEKLTKANLELKIKQEEILTQNEELMQSQEELEAQRSKLVDQNQIIEIQNHKLTLISENMEKLAEQKTQQLSQANLELINHNHQLEQFAFITAHNLRSPVARLLGLVNILTYKDQSMEANDEILKFIQQSAKDMDEVMQDLNDILEIKKGGRHSFEKLNINEKLAEVYKLLETEIKNNKAQIQTDFSQTEDILSINAYFKSILYNLLSNAIKYKSDKRELFIYIYTSVFEDEICLTFQDNGLGIDLKRFGEQIFSLYRRFHVHKEGKGLGLYLVKTQMEAMKGRIEIKSELDKGTSFYLYFKK